MPSGGALDSIPPLITKSSPENFSTNFTANEIKINFNEYIKLKELQQNLVISPPLENLPIITPLSTSKTLKIKIEDSLKEHTTYSINFGKSIVDNNEENEFEYFKYVFSTGSFIDSLSIKGTVQDAYLTEVEKISTVLLYERNEKFTDSVIYFKKPTYVTRTRDSSQSFEFTNIKEGNYLLIALQEETNNYTFEPSTDKIGYIHKTVSTPNDSIYTISLFKEKHKYKIDRGRHQSKNKILFGYQGDGDSIKINCISPLNNEFTYTTYKEVDKDSIYYWFKPSLDIKKTDTLIFEVKNGFYKDTLAVKMKDLFSDSLSLTKVVQKPFIPRDTFKLKGNNPLLSLDSQKITVLNSDSVAIAVKTHINKEFNIASIIFDKIDQQQYSIEILPGAFNDFFNQTNDTLNYKITTLDLSDYGELGMKLENVASFPIIVELVDKKYNVVASKYLTENIPLYFNYITPDTYFFRVIYDKNKNKVWDTGNFIEKKQPEKIIYFPRPINIRPNFYLE